MKLRILCLLLALLFTLGGCSGESMENLFKKPYLTSDQDDFFPAGQNITDFLKMEYVRPDLTEHDRILEESCRIAEQSNYPQVVMQAVYRYYTEYDRFYCSYILADIYSCADTSDSYWASENAYCTENAITVDNGLETLYYALAASPVVEELEAQYFGYGFFDAYENDTGTDEILSAYLEQEARLENRYYTCSAALDYDRFYDASYSNRLTELAEILIELIRIRQGMAAYLGYDSYPDFAYEAYHMRDYTPQQAKTYMLEVGRELSQLYRDTIYSDLWDAGYSAVTTSQTLQYVTSLANALGDDIRIACNHMKENNLYDLTQSSTKYDTSFETYIPYYGQPYIFVCPYGVKYDYLTFAHEFGHFVNDYLCEESYAGTDVAEIHSQTMEYMSLLYADGGSTLTGYKLLDCLGTFVEESAYAVFEQELYALPDDQLTPENLQVLFLQVAEDFGLTGWDPNGWEFVTINHLYSDPMYMVSYVVSNDVAFQMYQLEQQTPGAGLSVYQQCLFSEESYLLRFTEEFGLESPFAPGHIASVRKALEEALLADG